MAAKEGDRVRLEYTGTLDDGTVFDHADECCDPFEFTLGSGEVLKAFEEAVVGMEVGESKAVTLEPEEAYGRPDPQLVKAVPREQFPSDIELEEGSMILLGLPDGEEIPAVLSKVDDDSVILDLNHPLSGMRLHFNIKLIEVNGSE
jgi:FKBP-type peptidyl-prolyl cis-trans isomerase 2